MRPLVVVASVVLVMSLNGPVSAAGETISVTPRQIKNNVGTSHSMEAAVANQDATPRAGTTVIWSISSGPNSGATLGPCTTNDNGRCVVAYTGSAGPGQDNVVAFADLNGNATRDADEPQASATVTWVTVPSEACLDVEVEGSSAAANEAIQYTAVVTDSTGTANDDTCEGNPVPDISVGIGIIDDDPNAYLSQVNGIEPSGQPSASKAVTSGTGEMSVQVKLVDPAALSDGRNEIRFTIQGTTTTDTDAATDSTPRVDKVEAYWQPPDTTPPDVSELSVAPNPFSPNHDGRKDSTKVRYTISESSDVTITIRRKGGGVVRRLLATIARSEGPHSERWNGRDDDGDVVRNGKYVVSVVAVDLNGNRSTTSKRTVTVQR